MPMRRGLKLFGTEGISAIKMELQQLHDLKVMEAKTSNNNPKTGSTGISHVSEAKAQWEDQGQRLCRWMTTTGIYTARGCKGTYRINGSSVHDCCHRCYGE